jgi:hypothetical protein
MFAARDTFEGLLLLAVLLLPALGVVLLWVAAHLAAGALKRRGP